MSNEDFLKQLISRIDQDQAALRQDQTAARQDQTALRSEMRDLRESIEARSDRMMENIASLRTEIRQELRQQQRFYIGTLLVSLSAAVAALAFLR